MYLSQFLYLENQLIYLKKTHGHLMQKYENIRADLYTEKQTHKELLKRKKQFTSDLQNETDIVENLKKQNIKLENLVKKYRSRKIVKIADIILKIYRSPKSRLNKVSNSKETSTAIYSENNSHLESFDKHIEKTQESNLKLETPKFKPKGLKDIKVAVILDEFSYNSFKYEFEAFPIEPSNWLEIFQTEKPDLFLCESARQSADSEKRPWQGKVNFYANSKIEISGVLIDILEYCKKNGIITIFWNKEDPTNFNSFFNTALRFDHIFTSEEKCIRKYKEEYGHKSVHSLMFAAQPKLFNPIEKNERTDDIIFAGSWYSHFTQRCKEMIEIFDNILDNKFNLKIYDRAYHTLKEDPKRIFPDKYGKYINPPVPHDQIEKVYKKSKYALNINTVTKSRTMFARRAFELMLCNTLVLSNYSKGLDNLFGDNIVFIGKGKIDLTNSEEKRINNLNNVLKNHTYTNRFKQILDTINYEYLAEDRNVTIYYNVKNELNIEKVLEHYNSINYNHKKLVLLLSNSLPDPLIHKYENEDITIYPLNYFLNPCKTISNDTQYFIFADLQLKKDFIEKAIPHYSYIEPEFGIVLGHKFIFKKTGNMQNVLFTNENFINTLQNMLNDNSNELSVYTIQI